MIKKTGNFLHSLLRSYRVQTRGVFYLYLDVSIFVLPLTQVSDLVSSACSDYFRLLRSISMDSGCNSTEVNRLYVWGDLLYSGDFEGYHMPI